MHVEPRVLTQPKLTPSRAPLAHPLRLEDSWKGGTLAAQLVLVFDFAGRNSEEAREAQRLRGASRDRDLVAAKVLK